MVIEKLSGKIFLEIPLSKSIKVCDWGCLILSLSLYRNILEIS